MCCGYNWQSLYIFGLQTSKYFSLEFSEDMITGRS